MTAPLRLACIDSDAPPLFGLADSTGGRKGFEPAVADLVAAELGTTAEWTIMAWGDMLPAVAGHGADAVLCGQAIIPARSEVVDFTRPYGIFHEGVLVRRGDQVSGPKQLAGRKVAAIDGSANMNLALTFDGADVIGFDGGSGDVYADMLQALREGQVDAVVDDDVVFVPLGETDPVFQLAFVVPTGNRWAIGVAKDRPQLREAIDQALDAVIADGRHEAVWRQWLPTLPYPFGG